MFPTTLGYFLAADSIMNLNAFQINRVAAEANKRCETPKSDGCCVNIPSPFETEKAIVKSSRNAGRDAF